MVGKDDKRGLVPVHFMAGNSFGERVNISGVIVIITDETNLEFLINGCKVEGVFHGTGCSAGILGEKWQDNHFFDITHPVQGFGDRGLAIGHSTVDGNVSK